MKIKSIHIEKLFGYYDYTLQVNENLPELLILFGDNGAGKTTILKMLYATLLGAEKMLSDIPFSLFSIDFDDKTMIKAFNKPHTLRINDFGFNSYKKIKNIVFITENRQINGIKISKKTNEVPNITEIIQALHQHIEQQQINYAQSGENSTQNIYKTIIEKMQAAIHENGIDKGKNYKQEIAEKMRQIEERSLSFSQYGLVTPFNMSEIGGMVQVFSDEQIKLAHSAIMPYFASQSAQLDALSSLQQDIHTFVTSVNNYFFDKKMTFHLSKGFSLHSTYEPYTELSFDTLSSGEKHFLRLLCSILMVSEEFTLFLIDEPEISLDVEWRRKLLKTFLTLGKNKNLQFIIATHSLELLASYRENIAQLKHKPIITHEQI